MRLLDKRNLMFVAAVALSACGNMQGGGADIKQLSTVIFQDTPEVSVSAQELTRQLRQQATSQANAHFLVLDVPVFGVAAPFSLSGTNRDVDTYLTSSGVSVSLRNGLLVATRGLGFDLMTADVTETLVALGANEDRPVRIHRYLDGDNQIITNSFVCSLERPDVDVIIERCVSTYLAFENTYNFDMNGGIIASEQWVSPQIGMIGITMIN